MRSEPSHTIEHKRNSWRIKSLSNDKQADIIDAVYTTSRYFDDILNINNIYFDNMVSQIYLSEIQLNKGNTSVTEATSLDLGPLVP